MGYGLSWYRVENASSNGVPFSTPNSDWIRKPSLSPLKNLLPNTWHFGGGFEWVPIRSGGRFPGGIDLGFKVEYALFLNTLGLELSDVPLDELGIVFPTLGDIPDDGTVTRHSFSAAATISF